MLAASGTGIRRGWWNGRRFPRISHHLSAYARNQQRVNSTVSKPKKIRGSIPPIERQYRWSILASEMGFSTFDLQQNGPVELAVHQHDLAVDDCGLADEYTTQAVGCDELLNAGRFAGATAGATRRMFSAATEALGPPG